MAHIPKSTVVLMIGSSNKGALIFGSFHLGCVEGAGFGIVLAWALGCSRVGFRGSKK